MGLSMIKFTRTALRWSGRWGSWAAIVLLSGCAATKQQPYTDASSFQGSPACNQSLILQKYGCSANQIDAAARTGDPDAQYALGYLYVYGIGVQKNMELGQQWIAKAAAQGQPAAIKALRILKNNKISVWNPKATGVGYSSSGPYRDTTTDVNTLNTKQAAQPIHQVLPSYTQTTAATSNPAAVNPATPPAASSGYNNSAYGTTANAPPTNATNTATSSAPSNTASSSSASSAPPPGYTGNATSGYTPASSAPPSSAPPAQQPSTTQPGVTNPTSPSNSSNPAGYSSSSTATYPPPPPPSGNPNTGY